MEFDETMKIETQNEYAEIGISIEPIQNVLLLAAQQQQQQQQSFSSSKSLTVLKPDKTEEALIIAQKLLENFMNFYMSFTGRAIGGNESIPAKVLQDWYNGLIKKAKSEPAVFSSIIEK